LSSAVAAIVAVIITSIIVNPILNRSNQNAKFHSTIDWRNELYQLSISKDLTRTDISKLQSLVSPLSESPEDYYINQLCNYLKNNVFNTEYIFYMERVQHIERLLLKLNWIKHGTISGLRFPLKFHLYPNYIRNLLLADYICDEIKNNIILIDSSILMHTSNFSGNNLSSVSDYKCIVVSLTLINFTAWTTLPLLISWVLYKLPLWCNITESLLILAIGTLFVSSVIAYNLDFRKAHAEITKMKKKVK